jgi:antitoxin CptB
MQDAEPNSAEWSRMQWRCRRGLLELDLVLQAFIQEGYAALSAEEKQNLERLLALPDNTLLAYVQGRDEPDDLELKQLLIKIL